MKRMAQVLVTGGFLAMTACGGGGGGDGNDNGLDPFGGGSSNQGEGQGQGNAKGSGGSKSAASHDGDPLSLAMTEVGTTSGSADPRLRDSVWGIADSTEGVGLGFGADNRYAAIALRAESQQVVQAMATVGTYSVTTNQIMFARKKTTCPSFVRSSAPTTYNLQDEQTLWLTSSSRTVIMKRLPRSSAPAMVIKWGCFSQDGRTFTEHAWTDL